MWHEEIRLIPISSAGPLIGSQEHIHGFLPIFGLAGTYRETGIYSIAFSTEVGPQLFKTETDIQTPQVVLHNLDRRLTRGITVVFIDTDKYIKKNAKYMSRAHTGIDDTNFLRSQGSVFFPDDSKLRLHLRLLLSLVQIVLSL